MGYTSETRESLPRKLWAMVTPESMAGVSEKMVSVATASFSTWDIEGWKS